MIPRARNTDPISSHIAAKNAHGNKAVTIRQELFNELAIQAQNGLGGLTARELCIRINRDYYDCQRRLSETEGIRKTGEMRDGQMIWQWVGE